MMPRLLAEQSRRHINELLAANGRILNDWIQREFLADLDREIRGDPRPRPEKLGVDALERGGMRVIRATVRGANPVSRLKPGQRPGLNKRRKAEEVNQEP